MTDRELLELAARAAGLTIAWDARGAYIVADGISGGGEVWNPMDDDGDTMRLAVKLGLEVSCDGKDKVVVGWPDPTHPGNYEDCMFYAHVMEPKGDAPYAATRRAVVRAAAALATKETP